MAQIEHVELRATITAATFAAYLKCPTKALLSAHGERPSDTFFTDIERDISKAYRTNIKNILSISFRDITRSSRTENRDFRLTETPAFITGPLVSDQGRCGRDGNVWVDEYVPVLHPASDKARARSDHLPVSSSSSGNGQAKGTRSTDW